MKNCPFTTNKMLKINAAGIRGRHNFMEKFTMTYIIRRLPILLDENIFF